jgi:ABC-2 type transport system permease protein
VLTSVLYLLIFGHVLEDHVQDLSGGELHGLPDSRPGHDVGAAERLCQFSSSSLIQSKVTGNIVFVLLPPISYREFYAAYVIGRRCVRGLVARACCWCRWFARRGWPSRLDHRLRADGRGLPRQPG